MRPLLNVEVIAVSDNEADLHALERSLQETIDAWQARTNPAASMLKRDAVYRAQLDTAEAA